LLANFLVTEIQLNPIARVEPVVCPSLGTLSLPTDPTSQQIRVVRISIQISPCPVVIPVVVRAYDARIGNIRVDALGSEIQFWESRKHRNVNSCPPHGSLRIPKGQGPPL